VSAGLLALLIPVCSQATALKSFDVGATSAKVVGHRPPSAVASLDPLELGLIEFLSQAVLNDISYLESNQPAAQEITFLVAPSIDPLASHEPQISSVGDPLTINALTDGTIFLGETQLSSGITDMATKVLYHGYVVDVSAVAASLKSGTADPPAIPVREPATILMAGTAFVLFAASLRRSDQLAKRRQIDLEERGRHRVRLLRQDQTFPNNGKGLVLNQ
jgi:hypothetical protein